MRHGPAVAVLVTSRESLGVAGEVTWRAVVAINTYRIDHDVTDRRTTIGHQPADLADQLDWYSTRDQISHTQHQLGIATAPAAG